MVYPSTLRLILVSTLLLPVNSILAQDNKQNGVQSVGDEFDGWQNWNASQWVDVLIELKVDLNANHILDRLSRFHLSSSQVRALISAAEQESSDSKRVVLWHAIRMSRDQHGRDYLIHSLLQKSSQQLQLQFVEQLRIPTRFDIPILAALYKNQPKEEKDSVMLQQAIVEFTCLTNWKDSVIDRTISPFREKDYDSEAMNEKRLQLGRSISREAERAQHEMVHWLIKNGVDDSHRVSAFERFIHNSDFKTSRAQIHDYGFDLIQGLVEPESKANIVTLAGVSIEPSRFLVEGEAEVVRLAAIKAIEKALIESRKAQSIDPFRDLVLRYRPVLEITQKSDDSVEVQQAAKLILGTIAEYERLDAKFPAP